MLKEKLESEFEEFLKTIPESLEFSVMLYPKTEGIPEFVRLKLSLNDDVQATLKCKIKDYKKFLKTSKTKLYFTGLFRKNMIKGDITLTQILRDAKPVHDSMASFFNIDPDSKYGNTKGLHCGKLTTEKQKGGLMLKIEDMNEQENISGTYTLKETNKYSYFYGTLSKELSLKKTK